MVIIIIDYDNDDDSLPMIYRIPMIATIVANASIVMVIIIIDYDNDDSFLFVFSLN
jgi:hypothetical protein